MASAPLHSFGSEFQPRNVRRSVVVLVVSLVLLATFPQLAVGASTSTSAASASNVETTSFNQSSLVEIDSILFVSTVPSFGTIGHNYTAEVRVVNNLDVPVPIILRVNVPLTAIYVHPQLFQATVQPSSELIANFTLIPFTSSYNGPLFVNAMLWVWFRDRMNAPQLVQEVNAQMYGVGPSPYQFPIIIGSLTAVALAIVVAVVHSRRRRVNRPPVRGDERKDTTSPTYRPRPGSNGP